MSISFSPKTLFMLLGLPLPLNFPHHLSIFLFLCVSGRAVKVQN